MSEALCNKALPILAALALAYSARAQEGARSPGSTEAARVTLIGVTHAPAQFHGPQFSPGHVRLCLERLAPDAVGVESAPEWFADGNFYRATYEARLAVSWARERGLEVAGIDWIGDSSAFYSERQRIARVRAARSALEGDALPPEHTTFGLARWSQARFRAPGESARFDRLNSEAWGATQLAWIDQQRDEAGTPGEYMERRDNHIADEIAALARRHPGGEVAVVIGAAHKLDLERKLRSRSVPIGDLARCRLGEEDAGAIEAAMQGEDLAAILSEALDAGTTTMPRERTESLAERLHALAGAQPGGGLAALAAYFEARLLQLEGRDEPAQAAFERAIASGGGTPFPQRGFHWRKHLTVAQAARLELGRSADLHGQREQAREHYSEVLRTIAVPPYSEERHDDYEYLAGARNALRSLLREPYRLDLEHAPARVVVAAAESASVNDVMARLAPAWDDLRAGRSEAVIELCDDILALEALPPTARCEALYLLASARVKTDELDAARRTLEQLDAASSEVPGHWVHRERAGLVAAIERADDQRQRR